MKTAARYVLWLLACAGTVALIAAASAALATSRPLLDAEQQQMKAWCVANGQPSNERKAFCHCVVEVFKGMTAVGQTRDAAMLSAGQLCASNFRRL